MPRLERNGVTYEISNPVQVAAFKAAGYVEVAEVEQAAEQTEADKPKRSRKAAKQA